MIRFNLKCANDHQFESWFQSNATFDKLAATGMVSCTACGSTQVSKSIMAPAVSTKGDVTPVKPVAEKLAAIRAEVEANSDYVGKDFAKEARDMHDGVTPERSIYGEAKLEDARKLVEDGVPVMPLPFIPPKRVN